MATKPRASKQRGKSRESPEATDLLVLELQQIHSAETQLTRQLPRLSKAAQSQALRSLLDERLEEGERLIDEIEGCLDDLDESPGRHRNVAAEGLINDAREHVQEIERGAALDAVLVGAIQKTEHYCIAAWGTAKALARATGQEAAARAMEGALQAGGPYDERLTELAARELMPALLSGQSEKSEMNEDDDMDTDGGTPRRERGRASEERTSR